MAGLSKSAVTIKVKSRDERKRDIPALIYTKFGTIYTILGITSGLTGRQTDRESWPACWDHWRSLNIYLLSTPRLPTKERILPTVRTSESYEV
jgi:hypothetical protein